MIFKILHIYMVSGKRNTSKENLGPYLDDQIKLWNIVAMIKPGKYKVTKIHCLQCTTVLLQLNGNRKYPHKYIIYDCSFSVMTGTLCLPQVMLDIYHIFFLIKGCAQYNQYIAIWKSITGVHALNKIKGTGSLMLFLIFARWNQHSFMAIGNVAQLTSLQSAIKF